MSQSGYLGRQIQDGEAVIRQGEIGDKMYVVQAGTVEVVVEQEGVETRLALLSAGDFFGEMGVFERETRSATVRACGEARVLTIDKRTLLRRINEDPSLAFRIIETMSQRIRKLDAEVADLKANYGTVRPS